MSTDLRAAIAPDVLDLIHESVLLRAIDGRVLYWNAAATKLYGWTAAQAVGKDAHQLLNARTREPLAVVEAKLLAAGHWCGKVTCTAAGGNELVVDASWTVRRDGNGNPLGVLESSWDVTAQERGSLARNDPQRRYRNLFESPAAAFFEVDFSAVAALLRQLPESGVSDVAQHLREHPQLARQMMQLARVLDVNDRAVAWFGLGRKRDLLGPLEVFWPVQSTSVFLDGVLASVSGQANFACETVLRDVQGVEFDVDFAVHFDPDNSSGIVNVAVVDISERNRARAALERAEFMYRNMFYGMAVPFLRLDSTGLTAMFAQLRSAGVTDLAVYMAAHPEFVAQARQASIVVEANEAAVKLFGARTAADLQGPLGRLMVPGHEPAFRASLALGFAGAAGYQSETKLQRLDARQIDVMLFVIATPEMRAKGIVLLGVLDIAEQVAARADIERMRADLGHASRVSVLGELTASIAHEINQPLTAIATNAEAGLRWLARDDFDIGEIRTLMGRMVADARRAADIIQRVRGMAMRRGTQRATVAINDLVEETIQFLHHELHAHGVRLTLELGSNLPAISADRIQIQQVIVNLAMNAIQAMSHVAPELRRLRIATAMADTGHVIVHVEDSGPGIAAESLPRLFERFYSTKSGGMGMGLSISQCFVEAHGGRLGAVNMTDLGARFSFTLAVAAPADVEQDVIP